MATPTDTGTIGIVEQLKAAQADVAAKAKVLEEAQKVRDRLVVLAIDTRRVGYREAARIIGCSKGNIHRILTDAGAYAARDADDDS